MITNKNEKYYQNLSRGDLIEVAEENLDNSERHREVEGRTRFNESSYAMFLRIHETIVTRL
jgi:hypothetical protein